MEAAIQQTIPNFQDSAKPGVGAWQGRNSWASAAQFLPHNSDATHYSIALSMQVGDLKEVQIGTRIVYVGAFGVVFGGGYAQGPGL
eukprot:1161140-Pelagomonas_calceolata.AAC.5